jgi:hypothetical protein
VVAGIFAAFALAVVLLSAGERRAAADARTTAELLRGAAAAQAYAAENDGRYGGVGRPVPFEASTLRTRYGWDPGEGVGIVEVEGDGSTFVIALRSPSGAVFAYDSSRKGEPVRRMPGGWYDG